MRDVRKMYNLPAEISFCKKCTISNQRPRISFDSEGVCSACRYAESKRTFDWKKREEELQRLCDRFRSKDGSHDVVVPCSGGKDGGFVAHTLKTKYGMHPLTVTFSPQLPSTIGRKNLDNFINTGGFDHVLATPNGRSYRQLSSLALKYMGDSFQPFIYGVSNFPLKVAVQNGISLLMYGENGEVEYGGDMKNAFKPTREITDHDKHYFSGIPPQAWIDHGISPKELEIYLPAGFDSIQKNKTEIHFMGYYHFWDPQENFYYCVNNTGFEPNPERSEGTYSKYASLDDKLDGFHYYFGYIKFGIGRATSDSAHEIRDQKISREEGAALVKKFDGEFPAKFFPDFLEYCEIKENEFFEIVDSWRSDHIWKKEGGKWVLRKGVWE